MARPIIIDCDPGVDDAIALMLALSAPELDVQGITTVAGNVSLALTEANARRLCELMERRDVPVYAGCPRPILRPLITAEAVHGSTGLDGAALPMPTLPLQPQHAVTFLIAHLSRAAAPLTLITLGPLTNIAIALIQQPQIRAQIAEIVMMGGGIRRGNITPVAEFNIYVDPHAARVVFEAGIPITLLGLDVTHQVLTTPDRLAAIRALKTPVSQVAADLLAHYGRRDRPQADDAGEPLHDPCVIAYLLQPQLFTTYAATVAVETDSPLTLGQTVVTPSPPSPSEAATVRVAAQVDAAGIYALLQQRLGTGAIA